MVGFDANGDKKYGYIEFNLANLPKAEDTTISNAYIEITADKIDALNNMRFHIEMVVPCDDEKTYEKVKQRDIIERIGYDVSATDIKECAKQRYVFDTYAIEEMLKRTKHSDKAVFIISASSENPFSKLQNIDYIDDKRQKRPTLVINYIKKRHKKPKSVKNLKYSIEKGIVKLTWDNPTDDAFRGVIVVKNALKIPSSPYDGQKLYGGSDNYTYDNFGDKNTKKYYAVFVYDDVPNFSDISYIEYKG